MAERGWVIATGTVVSLLAGCVGQLPWYRAGTHSWSGAELGSGLTWTLAVASAAGFVAMALTRRILLRAIAALIVVIGLMIVAAPGAVGAPSGTALAAVTSAELAQGVPDASRWWFSAAGILVCVAAVWSLVRGGRWAASAPRFARQQDESRPREGLEMWKSQDAGHDPTDEE